MRRQNARKKVGLALGSGAARGLAHIGVLEVLEKEGIPIGMIAGASAGALIGILYALGKNIGLIKEITTNMSWARLLPLVDLSLPRSGLIRGKGLTTWLRSVIGRDVQFSDLKIPVACVATDINTGEEVVINQGSVLEAVRATISIPGVFTVVEREGKYLVDGGLVNPVPVSVVRNMGAEFVIAVNVIPNINATDKTYWLSRKRRQDAKEPTIIDVIMQSIYINTHSLAKSSMKDANIAIEPRVAHINPADFRRRKECIIQGELATRDAIPKIKKQLASLK